MPERNDSRTLFRPRYLIKNELRNQRINELQGKVQATKRRQAHDFEINLLRKFLLARNSTWLNSALLNRTIKWRLRPYRPISWVWTTIFANITTRQAVRSFRFLYQTQDSNNSSDAQPRSVCCYVIIGRIHTDTVFATGWYASDMRKVTKGWMSSINNTVCTKTVSEPPFYCSRIEVHGTQASWKRKAFVNEHQVVSETKLTNCGKVISYRKKNHTKHWLQAAQR
jgi:hypothetical protein